MIHSPVVTPPPIPPRPVSTSPAASPAQLSNRPSLQFNYPHLEYTIYQHPHPQQQQQEHHYQQQATVSQHTYTPQLPAATAFAQLDTPLSSSDNLQAKEHPYYQSSRFSLVAQPTYLLPSPTSSVTSISGTPPPNRAQYQHHRLSAPLPLNPSVHQHQLEQQQQEKQERLSQHQLPVQRQHSFHGTSSPVQQDLERDLTIRPKIAKANSLPVLVPPPIPNATRPQSIIIYPTDSTLLIKPGTLVGAPALVRMSLGNGNRFITAGPPKIIKNPQKIKALLDRPVPRIAVPKRLNTLLGDFCGDDVDVNRHGKVVDTSAAQNKKQQKRKKSRKLAGIVVGIDLGNTFTAISYAHQNDGEMIDVVKWPKSTIAYSKVPTVSLYNSESGVRKLTEWGSSAVATIRRSKGDRTLISDYKLQFFDQGRRAVMKHGLFLTDVLTHFLRGLHEYLMEEINKAQVAKSGTVPMHYCITVPTSWSRSTRSLVLRSYVDAGIIPEIRVSNVTVITEAEAAAAYCREHCVETDSLEDGDLFMVCDAGGRTTQVTVFRVDESLGVRQFVYLSSSYVEDCGSAILDQNFKDLVLYRLSGLDLNARPQRQKALETLLEGFTEIKFIFDARAKEEIKHLSVPMGLDIHELNPTPDWMEDDFMAISGQELCEKVFDPVIEMIVDLILGQAHEHPQIFTGLFLVGGFGSNKYLLHKLKESFVLPRLSSSSSMSGPPPSSRPPSNTSRGNLTSIEEAPESSSLHAGLIEKIVMVPKAELAVARGAVIYGLKSAAKRMKSPKHVVRSESVESSRTK